MIPKNPHSKATISPLSLLKSIIVNRELIQQLTKSEIIGRYKGSVIGIFWSLLNPMLLLALYTVVFSGVFKARWGTDEVQSKAQFAMVLFVGMIVHSLFSETLVRAPHLIMANVSYVKKIVFPLEILPVIAMGTAVFHALMSTLVLTSAVALLNGSIHWTMVLLPLILLPLVVLSLGLTWALASIGVFLRDIAHTINFAMTVLLFASPVFYPTSALPAYVQPWVMLNPLTFIIEQARAVIIYGELPNIVGWLLYSLVSLIVCWLGYIWFQKTRRGFSNVL